MSALSDALGYTSRKVLASVDSVRADLRLPELGVVFRHIDALSNRLEDLVPGSNPALNPGDVHARPPGPADHWLRLGPFDNLATLYQVLLLLQDGGDFALTGNQYFRDGFYWAGYSGSPVELPRKIAPVVPNAYLLQEGEYLSLFLPPADSKEVG